MNLSELKPRDMLFVTILGVGRYAMRLTAPVKCDEDGVHFFVDHLLQLAMRQVGPKQFANEITAMGDICGGDPKTGAVNGMLVVPHTATVLYNPIHPDSDMYKELMKATTSIALPS